jgi:hypothetical protein
MEELTFEQLEDFAARYARANSDDEDVRRQIRTAIKACYFYITTGDVDGEASDDSEH